MVALEKTQAGVNGEEEPLDTGFESKLEFTFRHQAPCTHVMFTHDSEFVVSASLDCTLRMWSTATGQQVYAECVNMRCACVHIDMNASCVYSLCMCCVKM
jgi:WD40 repeat protein